MSAPVQTPKVILRKKRRAGASPILGFDYAPSIFKNPRATEEFQFHAGELVTQYTAFYNGFKFLTLKEVETYQTHGNGD